MSSSSKMPLPAQFTRINNAMGVYYIVHGLVLWLGGAAIANALYESTALPWPLQWVLMALCVTVSGMGMFFMALQGHEGFHGNLNANRAVSMVMGIVASSVAPFFVSVGYNVIHWQHHLHTNTEKDPDYLLYRGNQSFLARLFNGPRDTMLRCLGNAFKLMRGQRLIDRHYPFTPREAQRYAVLNLLLMVAALVVYAGLALHDLRLFALFVALPAAISQTYWAITPYIEHAGTGVGKGNDARTCTSTVLTVLLAGYTYHLCHHLYPRVQLHKLPALYRYLVRNGHLDASHHVEGSLAKTLRIGSTWNLKF